MSRVVVILTPTEKEALATWAKREHREPREQAAFLIRQELQRLRLLPTDSAPVQAIADSLARALELPGFSDALTAGFTPEARQALEDLNAVEAALAAELQAVLELSIDADPAIPQGVQDDN